MSITKTICIVAVSIALALFWSCGSKKTPEKAASETPMEQHDMHEGNGQAAEKPAEEGATKELVAQTTCPVMGGQIDNKKLYVDKDGKRIYMCCEGCKEELTKNFEANLKKLEEMGQKAETL